MLPRLGVGLLAKRDRPLDEQGLLSDVSPPQTQRLTRTKTPAYARTEMSVASRASSAFRIASIVPGESG